MYSSCHINIDGIINYSLQKETGTQVTMTYRFNVKNSIANKVKMSGLQKTDFEWRDSSETRKLMGMMRKELGFC